MQTVANQLGAWVNRLTSLGRRPQTPYNSFYDLEAKDIEGNPIDFGKFRGKARRIKMSPSVSRYCSGRASRTVSQSTLFAFCQVVLLSNVASLDVATKQNYQVSLLHVPRHGRRTGLRADCTGSLLLTPQFSCRSSPDRTSSS